MNLELRRAIDEMRIKIDEMSETYVSSRLAEIREELAQRPGDDDPSQWEWDTAHGLEVLLSEERLLSTVEKHWGEAKEDFEKSIVLNLNAVVCRAESAWKAGHVLLPLRITLENLTDSPKAKWRRLAGREELVQSAWIDALERVTAVGWRLHTWSVGEQSGCLVPVPLFERPAG